MDNKTEGKKSGKEKSNDLEERQGFHKRNDFRFNRMVKSEDDFTQDVKENKEC